MMHLTGQKRQITTSSKPSDQPQQLRMEFTTTSVSERTRPEVSTAETLAMLADTDQQIKVRSEQLITMQVAADSVRIFAAASKATGGFVVIHPNYKFLPVLQGKDDSLVFLYQFVEAIEEKLDYDELKAEYPMLSYGQIAGGIAFLRKLAQFNIENKNIDDIEDQIINEDQGFVRQVRESLTSRTVERVLTP